MSLPRIMVVAGDSESSHAIEDFGEWSHMANLLADGTALDARNNDMTFTAPWGHIKAGVRLRPPGYLQAENKKWAIYEFGTPEMYEPWKNSGLAQIGKPYDSEGIWAYIWGLFTGRHTDHNYDQADPSKSRAWYCDALSLHMASYGCHYLEFPESFTPYTRTPGNALDIFTTKGARLVASSG